MTSPINTNSTSCTISSLDCPRGLSCRDYECELRHLDDIEKSLLVKSPIASTSNNNLSGGCTPRPDHLPQKPTCVITASPDMGRTASTWVFNAVRLLFRQASAKTTNDGDVLVGGCDSYWMREMSASKIQARVEFATSQHQPLPRSVLIKTHEFTHYTSIEKLQSELLDSKLVTHVIVSVRNGSQFQPDPAWMKLATLVVHYEDIVLENPSQNPNLGSLKVLRQMADHMELGSLLTEEDLKQVDYQLMTLPIPGDQASKFWSFHARRGGRACPPLPVPPAAAPAAVSKEQHAQSTSTAEAAPNNHHKRSRDQPPEKRLVFVTRHGARLDNGPDRDPQWLSKAPHNRRTDAPLSPLGHVEAQELAHELFQRIQKAGVVAAKTEDLVIVSSPYIRCLETAEAVARYWSSQISSNNNNNNNNSKITIKVEPGIAEVGSTASSMGASQELEKDGAYSFSSWLDTTYEPVMTRANLPHREYGDGAAAQRAQRVAQTIAHDKFPNTSVLLLVGHGASCLGLVSAFGAPQDYIGYCSVTQFESSPSSSSATKRPSWKRVGKFGYVDHLSDPQVSLNSAW